MIGQVLLLVYNKTIYIFRKYMKQAFVSYLNKCLFDC